MKGTITKPVVDSNSTLFAMSIVLELPHNPMTQQVTIQARNRYTDFDHLSHKLQAYHCAKSYICYQSNIDGFL